MQEIHRMEGRARTEPLFGPFLIRKLEDYRRVGLGVSLPDLEAQPLKAKQR